MQGKEPAILQTIADFITKICLLEITEKLSDAKNQTTVNKLLSNNVEHTLYIGIDFF